jgi:predicted molibdopterin-dependent oxidoreductase YjgC
MRLRIDNIEVEAEKGETILDCARKSGITIPTLCHRDGIGHYSTCMVCMVKDKRKDSFIPSCTALAQDEMDIDASGDDVLQIRKKAVELLLSEHRAECEAQCRIVCPGGYNIPLMNRLLMAGKIEEAIELSLSELDGSELKCLTCPAYCENACRRKKIDKPVSIRNIRIFIYNNRITWSANSQVSFIDSSADFRKRFSSRIGRIEDTEQREWLKECKGTITRFREISDLTAASGEAESCMHCDCRAAQDCNLRNIAEKLNLKDPKGKYINAPISKKINHKTGLIFENAKCIKCGLCVRICKDSIDEPALCFINRGFVSIISEPLTEEFDDLLATKTDIVIDVCPTGALGHFKSI